MSVLSPRCSIPLARSSMSSEYKGTILIKKNHFLVIWRLLPWLWRCRIRRQVDIPLALGLDRRHIPFFGE
jgi:hypothetical protein